MLRDRSNTASSHGDFTCDIIDVTDHIADVTDHIAAGTDHIAAGTDHIADVTGHIADVTGDIGDDIDANDAVGLDNRATPDPLSPVTSPVRRALANHEAGN